MRLAQDVLVRQRRASTNSVYGWRLDSRAALAARDRAGHDAGSTSSSWIKRHRWLDEGPTGVTPGLRRRAKQRATKRLPAVGRCRAR